MFLNTLRRQKSSFISLDVHIYLWPELLYLNLYLTVLISRNKLPINYISILNAIYLMFEIGKEKEKRKKEIIIKVIIK